MKHFMKLLNLEVSRFILLFAIMVGGIVGVQLTTVLLNAKNYVNSAQRLMKDENLSYAQYAAQYGKYDLTFPLSHATFFAPIVFGITVLIIYVFFIWYRDWFGRANFSYRLFILPANRIHVYFAKLVAVLLFIFSALAIEVAVLYSMTTFVPAIVPSELYEPLRVEQIFVYEILSFILPISPKIFLFNYLLGTTAVTIIFTVIVFERSYRFKGIVFGLLFAIIAIALVLVPYIYQVMTSMLFIHEIMLATAGMAIVVTMLSIATAHHLLKTKINV